MTSFLATTVTQSVEVLTNAVANVADVMEGSYEGAEILGIHFEGPYLDMKYKGAQPPEYIAKPSVEQFKHYQQAARGHIRYVTLAPEHDEGFALTHYLTGHGVVVSIGHSAATYEQAVMAYANGARSMTHVYNGMSPFAHRANGLVGAAYRIRTMYGEIICDGCHSTPAALNNYFMSKGPDYAIMISDALMAKGTPIGSEYIFGGNHITIYPDGSAHLDNGTLSDLADWMAQHPGVVMARPALTFPDGRPQRLPLRRCSVRAMVYRQLPCLKFWAKYNERYLMADKDLTSPTEIEFCTGSFSAVDTAVFKAVGGFDEDYFMYVEDADLTQKMRTRGKAYLVPQYTAIHAWHRAAHRSLKPFLWQLRSLLRYFSKWGFAW